MNHSTDRKKIQKMNTQQKKIDKFIYLINIRNEKMKYYAYFHKYFQFYNNNKIKILN